MFLIVIQTKEQIWIKKAFAVSHKENTCKIFRNMLPYFLFNVAFGGLFSINGYQSIMYIGLCIHGYHSEVEQQQNWFKWNRKAVYRWKAYINARKLNSTTPNVMITKYVEFRTMKEVMAQQVQHPLRIYCMNSVSYTILDQQRSVK